MSVAIRCPQCSKRFGVSEEALGHTMTCPNCKQKFEAVDERTIGFVGAPVAPPDARPATPRPPVGGAAPRPAPQRPVVTATLAASDKISGGRWECSAGQGEVKKKKKPAEGVQLFNEDGVWSAEIPPAKLATCPGLYLSGIATLYGGLSLAGLGFFHPWMLFIMGAVGFAGWWWAYGDYYHKWTDFAKRELLSTQAPSPWWLHGCMFAPIASLVIAGMLAHSASESQLAREKSYKRYAMRGDEASVRAAVDRVHESCFSEAHEQRFRRSVFVESRYFHLMDSRVFVYPGGPLAGGPHMQPPHMQPPWTPPRIDHPHSRPPTDPARPTPDPVRPTPNPVRPTPEPVRPTPEPVRPTPEPVRPTPEPVRPVPTPVKPPEPENPFQPIPNPFATVPNPATPANPAIEPRNADPVLAALADLKSGDFFKSLQGLTVLSSATVTDEHRAAVAEQLEKLLDQKSNTPRPQILRVMERWKTDDTAVKIASRLKDASNFGDRVWMYQTLESLKDPRCAELVAAQLPVDGMQAIAVLRAFGPEVAEGPTIAQLQSGAGDTSARLQICRFLGDIGTAKSLPALQAAAAGQDRLVQITAKSAIDKIKARK